MTKSFLAPAVLALLVASCSSSNSNQVATQSTSTSTSTQTTVTTQANANAPANVNAQALPSNSNAASGAKQLDACSLITNEEVAQIQGDQVTATKGSPVNSQGEFIISQCFYNTKNFANSVSLSLTQADPSKPNAAGPKKFWETNFHNAGETNEREEREHERERERERRAGGNQANAQAEGRGEGEEEEERVPPRKVTGVGDEAYWSASRVGGALYVLKGNSFLRISVGGAGSDDSRIQKCKALAQKALKRMP